MENASTGASSPSTTPGLPQQPAGEQPLSSSPRSGSSSSSSGGHDYTVLDAADDAALRHPKGKRKRTAAKDKAILEGAYLANPKPDKAARLEIVRQVSLNEKEVQIWFQNRRQNDRRKSRPLSPQEIAALRFGGIHALMSDPLTPFGAMPYASHGLSSSPPHLSCNTSLIPQDPSTTPLSSPDMGPWEPEALARRQAEKQQQQQQQQPQRFEPILPGAGTSSPMPSLSFSSSTSSIGYLANRWNQPSTYSTSSSFRTSFGSSASRDGCHDDLSKPEPFTSTLPPPPPPPPQQQQPPQQPRLHRPTHRPFRLSLSLDGKAELAGLSPSPPRRLPPPQPTTAIPFGQRSGSTSGSSDSRLASLPAIRRSGLSRSQSAIPSLGNGLTLPPITSLTGLSGSLESGSAPVPAPAAQAVHPPRLIRGRSRDVHAWVSVCNADTRVDDELSAQAQHEASGSAIAAISLLRSTSAAGSATSTSSVLQPNNMKRNATSTRSAVSKPGIKRPKLGRALSSVARMQTAQPADRVWTDDEKKKKLKLSTLLSGNDSDKENWSPDEEGGPVRRAVGGGAAAGQAGHGRRPLPSSRSAQLPRTLGDKSSTHSTHLLVPRLLGDKAKGAPEGLDIYEDSSSEGEGRGAGAAQHAPLLRAATAPGTADVEKFMRGGEVSPSKKGDLDCVAGLLSLSQGIWR